MSPEVTRYALRARYILWMRYINAICLQGKRCGVTGSHLIGFYLSVTLARASSPKIGEPRGLCVGDGIYDVPKM